jgi:hypothetical protein
LRAAAGGVVVVGVAQKADVQNDFGFHVWIVQRADCEVSPVNWQN